MKLFSGPIAIALMFALAGAAQAAPTKAFDAAKFFTQLSGN